MIEFNKEQIPKTRKENIMRKNIRLVLLGELILFVAFFLFNIFLCSGEMPVIACIAWFIDIPSLILIALTLIPGLLIMGKGGDFAKAFSVGIKPYSLLELKNIIGAVDVQGASSNWDI